MMYVQHSITYLKTQGEMHTVGQSIFVYTNAHTMSGKRHEVARMDTVFRQQRGRGLEVIKGNFSFINNIFKIFFLIMS